MGKVIRFKQNDDGMCPKCLNSGVIGPKIGTEADYVGPPCDCDSGKRLVAGGGARCAHCEEPIIPPQTRDNPCPSCGYWWSEGSEFAPSADGRPVSN